jgi:hypothetical protein
MMNGKGCHGFLCVKEEEERELINGDRERACERGMTSEEREMVSV